MIAEALPTPGVGKTKSGGRLSIQNGDDPLQWKQSESVLQGEPAFPHLSEQTEFDSFTTSRSKSIEVKTFPSDTENCRNTTQLEVLQELEKSLEEIPERRRIPDQVH